MMDNRDPKFNFMEFGEVLGLMDPVIWFWLDRFGNAKSDLVIT